MNKNDLLKMPIHALEFSRHNWGKLQEFTKNNAHDLVDPKSAILKRKCKLNSFDEVLEITEGQFVTKLGAEYYSVLSQAQFYNFIGRPKKFYT